MAIDVSGMSREEKLRVLAPGIREARKKREEQEQAQGTERNQPIAQSKGSITFRSSASKQAEETPTLKAIAAQVNKVSPAVPKNRTSAAPKETATNGFFPKSFDDAVPSNPWISNADVNLAPKSSYASASARSKTAKDTLDSYLNSPEGQSAIQEEEALKERYRTEVSFQPTLRMEDMPQSENVKRLRQLRKDAEDSQQIAENARKAEQDQAVYDEDMREISGMTDAERQQLKDYVSVRDLGRTENLITDLIYIPIKKRKAAGSLWDKYGEARLNELAETYARDLHQQERQEVQQAAQNASQGVGGAALTTLGSIVAKPIGSVAALEGRLDELGQRTGRYSTLDPYSPGDTVNNFFDDAKQNVQQQIAGDGSNVFRKGAAVLYQAGTGTVENVLGAITLGPGVTAAVNATGQLTRTISEASARGATAGQAYLLATSSAALDYAMDKIPLDNLFGLAKEGSTSALKAALKQVGIEATTEGASFIGSQLLDMAILQQNSEYAQNVQNYRNQGMKQPDAVHRANKDLIAQALQQMITAGISGGVSAGVSTAIGNARSRRAQALLDGETGAVPDAAPTEPAPEQPTAQPEVSPVDTAPDSPADQLLQNPQQLTQEPSFTPEQIRAAQQERDIQAEADRIRYEGQESVAQRNETATAPSGMISDAGQRRERLKSYLNEAWNKGDGSDELRDALQRMWYDENALNFRTDDDYLRYMEATLPDLEAGDGKTAAQVRQDFATPTAKFVHDNRVNAERDAVRNLNVRTRAYENARDFYGADSSEANAAKYFMADAEQKLQKIRGLNEGMYAALEGKNSEHERVTRRYQDLAYKEFYGRESSLGKSGQSNNPRKQEPTSNAADKPRVTNSEYKETVPLENPLGTVSRTVEEATTRRRAQQEAARQSIQDQAASLTGDQAAAAQPDTLGMQSTPSEDMERSRSVTNSGLHNADADIRAGYRETLRQDPEAGIYPVKHNADTLDTAQQRTSSPERVRAEYDYLMNKSDTWTAEDITTGRLVAKELFKSGDAEATTAMNKQVAKMSTNAGQVLQAFKIAGTMKDASDPLTASESATARFLAMDQGDTTYKKTKNGPTFEQWQNNVTQEYTRIAMAVDSVPDGDVNAMRDVIRQIAQSRKTTAWFGTSSRLTKNAQRILNKLDFDTLKKIANTQIAAMPDDFRARGKMEVAEGLRKQGMLSSLKTFERNLAGNSATGLLDSFSDSIGGRFVDSLMAKATGKRTVGNDLKLPGKYLSAAKDSADFASLCVELNVPIETDANAAFDSATGANGSGKYIGKTFRSNGNFAMRALYGYQKYMSYALEVSDKIFEGGTNAAVTDSLNRLKNSNLSDAEVSELAEFTANRRTFKDATWEENGKTHGSNLSRIAQQMKNVGKGTGLEPVTKAIGDTVLPFASVPMNVAQTGVDYTAGIGKGAVEIASILKDARAGKEISVARQRQAASDFGRGATGMAFMGIMAGAAAKGIIQVHNDSDKNKKALDQSQGLSGAQINWSALGRASEGGSEKWQTGDVVTSLDFLEPFNTQMYLAVELSKEDTMQDILKSYPKATFSSVVSSFMDSPMVDGLTQLTDLLSNGYDAVKSGDTGDLKNALAEYGGNVASSFIPQFVRQTAQTMDGYYRDTRGKDSAEYAKNSILNAIPGASETLPKKVNGFGQEQKRGGFVTNFLDPTNTHRLQLDKTAQSLDELSQNPDVKNIYPERQAPLKVKDASGEDLQLTAEQRETYQKEYGKRVKDYYDGLLKNASFDNLSDEMKAEALQKAKEYGTQFARAAVTDYKDVPKNSSKTAVVFDVVRDVLKSNTTSAMNDLEKAWELGTDTKKATDSLNAVYDAISKMQPTARRSILEKSSGNEKIYLEARNSGLPSDKTLSMIQSVRSIPEKDSGKRPVKLQTVAGTKGLSESQMDTAMKLYMPDYDPTDDSPDKTEVKYDYIRRELGLSAKEYADTYYAYLYADTDGDGKSKKDDKVQGIIDLGFDKKMAEQLYHIYAGSGNATRAAIAKFIEENY